MSKIAQLPGNHQLGNDLLLCGICERQFIEPKSLSCRHTFCKSCLLATFSFSSSAENYCSPLKCPTCKQQVSNINTSEDIEKLKCDFFELNLMNARDNETPTDIDDNQNVDSHVTHSQVSVTCNDAAENYDNKKLENLDEISEKCATHPDFSLTHCCMNCQLPLCEQCMKDIWFADINPHSTHRVNDLKTTWKYIRDGIQRCDETVSKIKQECLNVREETCTKKRADTKKSFDITISIMTQQLNKIDEDLRHAFEDDENLLLELEKKCNDIKQETDNMFSISQSNGATYPLPSAFSSLLQMLNNALKTLSDIQQCKTQFQSKQSQIDLTLAITDEKCIRNVINQFIMGEIIAKESIFEKNINTAPKLIKANFCYKLINASLQNIFAHNNDNFSVYDDETSVVYNFDDSFSLLKEIPCPVEDSSMSVYYVLGTYIFISHSQRTRRIYMQNRRNCVKEVKPLVNADNWALHPISSSISDLRCAHAYITRHDTKGIICLQFCANNQNKLNIIKTFKQSTNSMAKQVESLTLVEDTIIPDDKLLLVTNKDYSLFSIAYLTHIFVLDINGNLFYQFDSTEGPQAMCFNQIDQVILAKAIGNNRPKFEVRILSSKGNIQSFLTYNHEKHFGILTSVAVNHNDITYLSSDNGFILALTYSKY